MTIIYLDCQAGISGDMTVGALLDLGVPLEYLSAELARLGLPQAAYSISAASCERGHLAALKFDVAVHDEHTHRDYAGIDALIVASGLAERSKQLARRIFRRLAEAEALVHGVAVADVHFHEVGAVDSIIDIVATAICLDWLGVEQLYVSPLPLCSGFVESAHGCLPLPAPATAELLKGVRLHNHCGPGERVTPTGAAIVAALAVEGKSDGMRLERIGCGAGSKDFADCPNILRAMLGSIEEKGADETVLLVESNIDDSTAELLGFAMERLLEAGALDCWFTPIQMKKNRPAVMLSFLCRDADLGRLSSLALTETTAIGVRYYPASRVVLERRLEQLDTPYGKICVKRIYDQGRLLRSTPEYEDCRRIARELGIPCREVMEKVAALLIVAEEETV